jgi:hypothetical protein
VKQSEECVEKTNDLDNMTLQSKIGILPNPKLEFHFDIATRGEGASEEKNEGEKESKEKKQGGRKS